MEAWELLVAIAAGGVIVDQVWTKVIVRVWQVMRNTVEHIDADKVLMGIAQEFKPNNGTSLVDRLMRMEQKITANTANIAELTNKIDVFILERRPGGQRSSDPQPQRREPDDV